MSEANDTNHPNLPDAPGSATSSAASSAASVPQSNQDSTPSAKKNDSSETQGIITFDEFLRVDMRVAQILTAERIEKSDKLIKLSVDCADPDGPRQIVAGIAEFFSAEDLPGRKIIIVSNLKPRKLMGELSHGMLLAARDEHGGLELVTVGDATQAGTRIG